MSGKPYDAPIFMETTPLGRKILRAMHELGGSGTAEQISEKLAVSAAVVRGGLIHMLGTGYVFDESHRKDYPVQWGTVTSEWDVIQHSLHEGDYGDWDKIRSLLAAEHSAHYPDDGISSSDMNHMAFGAAKSGSIQNLLEWDEKGWL